MARDSNCEYGTTRVGILKIVTVVIGIIVVILLFEGARQAHYFHHKENKRGICESFGLSNAKNCPRKGMVIVPSWICLFGCIISAIGLITCLFMRTKYYTLQLMDFIYHIIFGILIIFGGIFVLCYACLAYNLNDCDEGGEEQKEHCNDEVQRLYKPNFFLPASIFAIINGIIYVITGMMMIDRREHRERRRHKRRYYRNGGSDESVVVVVEKG